MLGEALQQHQAGLLDQAAFLYQKVLGADSDNVNALHLLGMVALQKGQPEIAAGLFRKAIAINGMVSSCRARTAIEAFKVYLGPVVQPGIE